MISLLEMSITGGILILVIIVLRALAVNRMPKKAFLILWAAAAARLALPLRLPSPVSIYRAAGEHILQNTPGFSETGRGFRPLLIAGQGMPDTGHTVSPVLVIWLGGLVLLALAFLITHLRSRSTYLSSLPVDNSFVNKWIASHRLRRPIQARYSDQIGAPLTYGILWPVLLLPKNINWRDEETLGFILTHEFSHIRRFDTLTKWVLAAVLCVHWFNPFVWAMYVLANRDLELSCDEAVLRQYGMNARSSYALALVGMEEKRTRPAPLASGFSRQALKERVLAIMSSRPLTFGSILAACAVIAAVVALFATNAPSGRPAIRVDEQTPSGPTAPSGPDEPSGPAAPSGPDEPSGPAAPSGPDEPSGPATSSESPDEYPASWAESRNPDEEAGEPEYTQEEYDKVIAALKFEHYEDMSIAEFNRRVNAAFYGEDGYRHDIYELYQKILYAIPEDDPNGAYLINTVQVSQMEYNNRMEEVTSRKEIDHTYYGYASIAHNDEVFGDPITFYSGEAGYEFTYRILDQDNLTVKERDMFLHKIVQAAQNNLEEGLAENITELEYKEALEAAGKEASGAEITFTGCEIRYISIYE